MTRIVSATNCMLKIFNTFFLNNSIKYERVTAAYNCKYYEPFINSQLIRYQSTLVNEKQLNIKIRSISPFESVDIYKNPNLTQEAEIITIPNFINDLAESYGEKIAFMSKDLKDDKVWVPKSFKEIANEFEKLSKIFIKLGLQRHESVAILSRNCVEWIVAEMAAIYAGGQAVGLYTSSSPKYCEYILKKSQAKILIVDEDFQMEKIKTIRGNLPDLRYVIQLNPTSNTGCLNTHNFLTWNEVNEEKVDQKIEADYQARKSQIQANECCSIVFTSGTTGDPKGAMLSHDNLIFYMTQIVNSTEIFKNQKQLIVSNLPFCHVAGQMEFLISMYGGSTMHFDNQEPLKGSLINLIKEVKPTILLTIPRVYEKITEKLRQVDGKIPKFLVKKIAGLDKIKYFGVGAGALSPEILNYLDTFGIKVNRLYGLTETSGMVCLSNNENFEIFSSVGKNLPSIEVKISKQDADGVGEILIRGRNVFMGYVDNIDKTIEAIDDDRWLHTGDLGRIDESGNVFVTGRIKELLVTSGGVKIPFSKIEDLIKHECAAISNAFLVGNERKFVTILLTMKTEIGSDGQFTDQLTKEAFDWFKKIAVKSTRLSEIVNDNSAIKAIQTVIDKVNEKAEINAYKIQKFAILPTDFSILTEEFTPTLKVKRDFVEKKYSNVIDMLYK